MTARRTKSPAKRTPRAKTPAKRKARSDRAVLAPRDYPKIAALAARGLTREDVARTLGMSRRTLARVFERDDRAAEAFETGTSTLHEELVSTLVAKARKGDRACAMFLLKTRFGYRENSPVAVEHEHRVKIELPAALSSKAYERKVIDAEVVEP